MDFIFEHECYIYLYSYCIKNLLKAEPLLCYVLALLLEFMVAVDLKFPNDREET